MFQKAEVQCRLLLQDPSGILKCPAYLVCKVDDIFMDVQHLFYMYIFQVVNITFILY